MVWTFSNEGEQCWVLQAFDISKAKKISDKQETTFSLLKQQIFTTTYFQMVRYVSIYFVIWRPEKAFADWLKLGVTGFYKSLSLQKWAAAC